MAKSRCAICNSEHDVKYMKRCPKCEMWVCSKCASALCPRCKTKLK